MFSWLVPQSDGRVAGQECWRANLCSYLCTGYFCFSFLVSTGVATNTSFLTAKPQGKNILSYKNLTDVSWYYLYAFKISRLCSFHIFRSIDRIFLVEIHKFQVSIVSCFQILE